MRGQWRGSEETVNEKFLVTHLLLGNLPGGNEAASDEAATADSLTATACVVLCSAKQV